MANQLNPEIAALMASAGPKMKTQTKTGGESVKPGEVVIKVSGALNIKPKITGTSGNISVSVEKVG